MVSDLEILQAVEKLHGEWPDILGDDIDTLTRWLAATPRHDPEAIRQTTNRVLALLRKYPQAQQQLRGELGVKGDPRPVLRGIYEKTPGGPDEVDATTLMVCPEDPNHYRQRLRQKGKMLFCPEHGVALVPADSLRPRE